MTREEVEQYAKGNGLVVWSKEMSEKAIKALKQEPTTKNDLGVDCISRQAVLEGIAEWIADGYADSEADCSHISSLVTHLPSVTPQEPKTGHWIGTRRVGCRFGEYVEYIVPIKDGRVANSCHCSECGEWLTGSDEYDCYGNYCPNCGCRMVEPQESEG